jgi:hypothetical protein
MNVYSPDGINDAHKTVGSTAATDIVKTLVDGV